VNRNPFCHSCGIPLNIPDIQARGSFCQHCTNEKGQLAPRELIQEGIANWLKSRQPDLSPEKAMERAGFYIQAMPAWAER
jgi:hypothetical protein